MLEANSLTGVLAFFFYEHRYLSIPELGRLELSGDFYSLIDENQVHILPKGSISFISNPSEPPDPQLVEYITSRTRKMEALAIADLNSISNLAKEMLNMRQSYTFPGIASLSLDFRRNFIVTPEKLFSTPHYAKGSASAEMFKHAPREDSLQENEIYSSGNHRTFGSAIIVIICVLIVAALVYFLFLHKEPNSQGIVNNTENKTSLDPDKSGENPQSSDLAKAATSSNSLTGNSQKPSLSNNDLLHYEVVFEEADSARAFRRYNQLTKWGHKIILKTQDSVHYTLAVSITSVATDTTTIKDSMQIFYGRPVYIRYLSVR
ncbi:MAG: hypothetical protein ACRDE2_08780 [Chitinophagaceae bacterium]